MFWIIAPLFLLDLTAVWGMAKTAETGMSDDGFALFTCAVAAAVGLLLAFALSVCFGRETFQKCRDCGDRVS